MKELTCDQVNKVIREWRQGDCALGEHYFLYGYSPRLIINKLQVDNSKIDNDNVLFVQEQVNGLVIVTQTCDVVRSCKVKPYVEIAPLCDAPIDKFGLIKKNLMPGYAIIPALEDRKIIADLDRTMTVEKTVLVEWHSEKVRGCRTDEESRLFSWALGRKRSRFAFPKKFAELINPFIDRIREKHDKNTDEGRILREFKEIRVRAAPDWSSQDCTVTLLFFVEKEKSKIKDRSPQIKEWQNLIKLKKIEMLVVDYEEITAQEYRESVPLDLDSLSMDND